MYLKNKEKLAIKRHLAKNIESIFSRGNLTASECQCVERLNEARKWTAVLMKRQSTMWTMLEHGGLFAHGLLLLAHVQ